MRRKTVFLGIREQPGNTTFHVSDKQENKSQEITMNRIYLQSRKELIEMIDQPLENVVDDDSVDHLPKEFPHCVDAVSLANFDQLGDPVCVSALGEPHDFTHRLFESRVTLAQNLSANALKARVTPARASSHT